MDTINGTVGILSVNDSYGFFIIDFDHNSEIEGKGISFMGFKTAISNGIDVCLIDSKYNYASNSSICFAMNLWNSGSTSGNGNSNVGGWESCYMRNTIIPSFEKALSSSLKKLLKTSLIYSDNTGRGNDNPLNVTSTYDRIYLASTFEVNGKRIKENSAEQNF